MLEVYCVATVQTSGAVYACKLLCVELRNAPSADNSGAENFVHRVPHFNAVHEVRFEYTSNMAALVYAQSYDGIAWIYLHFTPLPAPLAVVHPEVQATDWSISRFYCFALCCVFVYLNLAHAIYKTVINVQSINQSTIQLLAARISKRCILL